MSRKILICLVTLAILFSGFAVMANAAPVSTESVEGKLENGINITSVSYKGGGGLDWSKIWNKSNTSSVQFNVTKTDSLEIIGRFDAPAAVTRISLTQAPNWPQRLSNLTVFLSADGEEWTEMFTTVMMQNEGKFIFDKRIDDASEYTYIKITKAEGWTNIIRCIVESDSTGKTSRFVEATPVASSNAADNRTDRGIWSPNNTTTWTGVENSTSAQFSTAMLEKETVIGEIEFTTGANGNRARGARILASADGTNWVHLDTMPSTAQNFTKYTFEVTDPAAYKYVKLEQASGLKEYYFSALRVVVYEAEKEEETPVIEFKGTQVKDDGDKYSLRFVAAFNHGGLELSGYSVTYKVTATYGTEELSYEGDITKIFNSIYYSENGEVHEETAAELGGDYLITLVARDIKDSYGSVVFKVQFTSTDPLGNVFESVPVHITANAGTIVQ